MAECVCVCSITQCSFCHRAAIARLFIPRPRQHNPFSCINKRRASGLVSARRQNESSLRGRWMCGHKRCLHAQQPLSCAPARRRTLNAHYKFASLFQQQSACELRSKLIHWRQLITWLENKFDFWSRENSHFSKL
jgi:hypothetical protein